MLPNISAKVSSFDTNIVHIYIYSYFDFSFLSYRMKGVLLKDFRGSDFYLDSRLLSGYANDRRPRISAPSINFPRGPVYQRACVRVVVVVERSRGIIEKVKRGEAGRDLLRGREEALLSIDFATPMWSTRPRSRLIDRHSPELLRFNRRFDGCVHAILGPVVTS